MKRMLFGSIIFMMLSVFSFSSCGDDDFDLAYLAGKWRQVYDEGVASDGNVYYTFTPKTERTGYCVIEVYDVFAGDSQYECEFTLSKDGRHITIIKEMYEGDSEEQSYDIIKLTSERLTWSLKDHPDIVQNFDRVK